MARSDEAFTVIGEKAQQYDRLRAGLVRDHTPPIYDLWGGAALTVRQVLAQFASIQAGNLVFDFGTDELTLQGVSSLGGMVDHILLS